jgi:hypothetical protein
VHTSNYSLDWARGVVNQYTYLYPRASELACEALEIPVEILPKILARHPIAWEAFKTLAKTARSWARCPGGVEVYGKAPEKLVAGLHERAVSNGTIRLYEELDIIRPLCYREDAQDEDAGEPS